MAETSASAPARRRHPVRPVSLARLALVLVAAVTLVGGAAACTKETVTEPEPHQVTLVLDFVPNAVHAGIYRAIEAGYYAREGIELQVVEPGDTSDSVKLVSSNQADIGLADPTDLATAREQDLDVGAVLALLQRPAGGLIVRERSDVTRPSDLEGRSVGVTGIASDEAVLKTLVEGDDGDLSEVRVVTIGFRGAQALAAGRIDGFIGFIAADGAQIEADGTPIRGFPLDEYGGPTYPGLVAFTSQAYSDAQPEIVNGFIAATTEGYEDTIEDTGVGLDALLNANSGLDRPLSSRVLEQYVPMFTDDEGQFGRVSPAAIGNLVEWLRSNGLLSEEVDPADLVLP